MTVVHLIWWRKRNMGSLSWCISILLLIFLNGWENTLLQQVDQVIPRECAVTLPLTHPPTAIGGFGIQSTVLFPLSQTHTHTHTGKVPKFTSVCAVVYSRTEFNSFLSHPLSHFSSFGRSLSTLKSKLTHYTAYGSSSKVSTVCVLFVLADVLVGEPRQKFKHLLAGF